MPQISSFCFFPDYEISSPDTLVTSANVESVIDPPPRYLPTLEQHRVDDILCVFGFVRKPSVQTTTIPVVELYTTELRLDRS